MTRLRVINLGLPKSGTTTLARALRRAGLRVADWRLRARQVADAARQGQFVADLIYEGYFATGDPLARLADFDAVAEMSLLREDRSLWPQMDAGVIAALAERHPGARFVATRRETRAIARSMLAWSNMADRLHTQPVPGLPPGYGQTMRERIQWIDAHHAHLARLFAGDPRFLELDVADPAAPRRLARHIGRPVPWWGRANVNRAAAI